MEDYSNPLLRFLQSKAEYASKGGAFDYDIVWGLEDFFCTKEYNNGEFELILNFLRWAKSEGYKIGLDRKEPVLNPNLWSNENLIGSGLSGATVLDEKGIKDKVVGVYIASNVPTETSFQYVQKWDLRDLDSFMFIINKQRHWQKSLEEWRKLEKAACQHAAPMPG